MPKELKLAVGDPLLLEVCMDVDEPRDVIWEKDGEMLRNENEDCRADMGFDGACNYLRIQRTELDDAGLYEVYGERGQNEISFFTSVQIGEKIPPPVSPKKRGTGIRSSSIEGVKTPPKVQKKPSFSSRESSVDGGDGSRIISSPPSVASKPNSRKSSKDVVSDDFIVPVEEKITRKTPPAPAVKPKSKSFFPFFIIFHFITKIFPSFFFFFFFGLIKKILSNVILIITILVLNSMQHYAVLLFFKTILNN